VTNGSDADFTVVDIDECESVPAYEAELIFLRHGLGRSPLLISLRCRMKGPLPRFARPS